jgi:hypothetical protein
MKGTWQRKNIVRSGIRIVVTLLLTHSNMKKSSSSIAHGAERSYFVENEMNLTPEQAVKIAGWLGLKNDTDHYPKQTNYTRWELPCGRGEYQYVLPEWLLSPEGQEALMDKLESIPVYAVNIYPPLQFDYFACKIVPKKSLDAHAIGRGPTRQEALVNTVVKMLEEK